MPAIGYRARVEAPAVIAVTVLPFSTPAMSTATGTLESVVLLLPNCPYRLAPAVCPAIGYRARVVRTRR